MPSNKPHALGNCPLITTAVKTLSQEILLKKTSSIKPSQIFINIYKHPRHYSYAGSNISFNCFS